MRVGPVFPQPLAPAIARVQPIADEGIDLPSGGVARLHEVRTDASDDGMILRFRYVADGFDPQTGTVDSVTDDLHRLCVAHAVPALHNAGLTDGHVVISLADQPSEFGVDDPEIRQVFEAFTIQGDLCIWEFF
ncbi:DUF6497 family protein [Rhodobacteraceae bacterium KMM 6894]|nr:DUF6497 family protein [Rhodobacteraceae bacterium KMM 6894]